MARVELVDAPGHVVERHRASSAKEADLLAASLRRRATAKLPATAANGHRPAGIEAQRFLDRFGLNLFSDV